MAESTKKDVYRGAYELQFQLLVKLCEPGAPGFEMSAGDGIVDLLVKNEDYPDVSSFDVKSENEELFRLVERREGRYTSRARLPEKEVTFVVERYGFFGQKGDTTYINVTEHRAQRFPCLPDRHYRLKVTGV